MKQDCTNSLSTANITKCYHANEGAVCVSGKPFSEPNKCFGPEVRFCTATKKDTDALFHKPAQNAVTETRTITESATPWCYIFVHHRKVKTFENQLQADNQPFFIHTSVKYVQKRGSHKGCKKVAYQTVSGLVFLKGYPKSIQAYLDDHFPGYHLCRNCSTGKAAEIPHSQMQTFMCVAKSDPERIRFLLHPFVYYAKNRTLLRITSGPLAGFEGYVIRIANDRKLVMEVGGMSVAIGGVHAERFEEVDKNQGTKIERETFYKRNLHERDALIDRYFHQVKSAQEGIDQAKSIEILLNQSLSDWHNRKIYVKEVLHTLHFIIEEIGYYFSPSYSRQKEELKPVIDSGRKVMQAIEQAMADSELCDDESLRLQTEYDELIAEYGYLFE